MQNEKTETPTRSGSSLIAGGSVAVLAVAMAGAAVIANPGQADLPNGVEIAPSDAVGANVLEPAPAVQANQSLSKAEAVERAIQEWTPTGGGDGRPKPSPKG